MVRYRTWRGCRMVYGEAGEPDSMLSTGLFDMEGVEIFEGDLVRTRWGIETKGVTFEVVKDVWGFVLVERKGKRPGMVHRPWKATGLKVIGNIWKQSKKAL